MTNLVMIALLGTSLGMAWGVSTLRSDGRAWEARKIEGVRLELPKGWSIAAPNGNTLLRAANPQNPRQVITLTHAPVGSHAFHTLERQMFNRRAENVLGREWYFRIAVDPDGVEPLHVISMVTPARGYLELSLTSDGLSTTEYSLLTYIAASLRVDPSAAFDDEPTPSDAPTPSPAWPSGESSASPTDFPEPSPATPATDAAAGLARPHA